jgi:hypothetical protein
MLRVLICGGRNYTDFERIKDALVGLGGAAAIELVIHGAARGADQLGGEAATGLGIPVQAVPANWDLYGRAAGPIRNQQMLNEHHPNLVLAFPDPESRGTWDMVRRAKSANVEVRVIQ